MESKSEENYNPEEYLLNTLNNLDIGFVKVNNAGVILNHNLTYNKIFGYNPEKNLIGTKILDYWQNTDDRDNFRKILYKNDIVKKYITSAKNLDGKQIFLELNFKLEKNSNGEIISSEGIFVDITERTEKEQNLKESEIKSQNIIENLPMGVHIYQLRKDGHLYFIGANPAADQILGVDNSLYIGKTIDQAFPNIVDTDIPEKFSEIAEKGGFWYKEDIIYEDKRIKGAFENFNFQSSQGIVVSLFNDISERKKAEQNLKESERKLRDLNIKLEQKVEERTKELQKSEEKYKSILEGIVTGVWVANKDDIIYYANKSMGEIAGVPPDQLVNANVLKDFSESTLEFFRPHYLKAKNTLKQVFYDSVPVITPSGRQSFQSGWLIPLIEDKNNCSIICTVEDITERKKALQNLKESEIRFRTSVENSPDFIVFIKRDGTIFELNHLVRGFTKETVIGQSTFNQSFYETKDQLESARKAISDSLESGEITQYYHSQIAPDGSHAFYETKVSPFEYDDEGRILSLQLTIREITERKKMEQNLKESEEKLRNLNIQLEQRIEERTWELKESEERLKKFMNSATDGFVLIDSKLNYTDANKVTLQMVGMTKEELIGKNMLDLAPNLKETGRYDKYLDVLKTGEPFSTEDVIYNRTDGSVNTRLSVRAFNVGDNLGIIFTDITERKEAEKKSADLAKFPSENPYPILRVIRNGVMYINNAGQKLLNVVDFDQIPEIFQECVKNSFESNQITEVEVEFDNRVYSFTITPVKDAVYVNIYGMDITERKNIEENLKEVNKLKSEFLRRASHELKTPLISIKGFSELILSLHEDQLETPIISKLREINDGCERLQNIINDLLKTSRLESPDFKPNVQKEDLSFLINFCVHELQSLAEKRKQSIKLDIHNKLFANIEKEEIHDVLSNLLTNAIKYTPPNGKIEVTTELKEDSVVVSVKDNGIGFTEEQKKMVFQQFGKIERYGKGMDLGIDGTGLGLYISKRIVEAHKGKIWMESEGKSKGSTFYFTIPTAKDTTTE